MIKDVADSGKIWKTWGGWRFCAHIWESRTGSSFCRKRKRASLDGSWDVLLLITGYSTSWTQIFGMLENWMRLLFLANIICICFDLVFLTYYFEVLIFSDNTQIPGCSNISIVLVGSWSCKCHDRRPSQGKIHNLVCLCILLQCYTYLKTEDHGTINWSQKSRFVIRITISR